MYGYNISKAVAVKRYDLIVLGTRIDHGLTRAQVQATANSMVVRGYLMHSDSQKKVLRKQGLYV